MHKQIKIKTGLLEVQIMCQGVAFLGTVTLRKAFRQRESHNKKISNTKTNKSEVMN